MNLYKYIYIYIILTKTKAGDKKPCYFNTYFSITFKIVVKQMFVKPTLKNCFEINFYNVVNQG